MIVESFPQFISNEVSDRVSILNHEALILEKYCFFYPSRKFCTTSFTGMLQSFWLEDHRFLDMWNKFLVKGLPIKYFIKVSKLGLQ